ncbi:MAG: hypothetical protein JRN18_00305 [Nitrososphaerota archaeon]|jgi:hypothetical protein|nr:hypothetical protein [Nitrososphaerota archaeon]
MIVVIDVIVTALLWGSALAAGSILAPLVVLPSMQAEAAATLFEFMFRQVPSESYGALSLVARFSLMASWGRTE